jgi:Rps23 Pro-64 3,4-dihydroxylase Tpa1-like proline 4-hydroxylase
VLQFSDQYLHAFTLKEAHHPAIKNQIMSEQDEQPQTKKIRTEGLLDILSPHILTLECKALNENYAMATPYPHGRMEKMFREGFLEKVLDEVKSTSVVKFKESDLFRVYQSIDLGNLADDAPQAMELPSLLELKRAIYSREYRNFIERVVGIPQGTLTEQVDCAVNCHISGCHLLCHDDVIGTRKVSYIIYLTEEGWKKEEGGALELYESELDSQQRRVPKPIPSKTLLPIFNTMAYFVVVPGQSFHAVQEVFGERPRLSIQGWYHAKEKPENMEEATLSQLKSTLKGEDTEGVFIAFDENDHDQLLVLPKEDIEHLSKYMNTTYITEESIAEIRNRFEIDSSVQLRSFIQPEWINKINSACAKRDEKFGNGNPVLDYNAGVDKDWKVVGPAHKQRFLEYTGTSDGDMAGSVMAQIRRELLESLAFGRFLNCITGLGMPLGHRGRVRRFRPALDYTVAHYGILTTQSVLDATLCFAAGNGKQCLMDEETGDLVGSDDDAIWASGDCGGFECYIAADDDSDEGHEEAADEYNADDDTELLSVSASNNTLSLVYRDPGTMRFVKYVGCRAPSSRWDLSMEYEVQVTESDDECTETDDTVEGRGHGVNGGDNVD